MNPYLEAMAKRDKTKFIEKHQNNLPKDIIEHYLTFQNPEEKYQEDLGITSENTKGNIRDFWEMKKDNCLRRVNKLRDRKFDMLTPYYIQIPCDIDSIIQELVEKSPFKKNRKRRLRLFLISLYQWDYYLRNLPENILILYDHIYYNFSYYINNNNLTPLPVALMGRWAGLYIPGRIPVNKIANGKLHVPEYILKYYQVDKTRRFYVLSKGLTNEEINILERYFIEHLKYCNRSRSKYIFFLKYLIKEGILEPVINYSTNCKCRYYKLKWKLQE